MRLTSDHYRTVPPYLLFFQYRTVSVRYGIDTAYRQSLVRRQSPKRRARSMRDEPWLMYWTSWSTERMRARTSFGSSSCTSSCWIKAIRFTRRRVALALSRFILLVSVCVHKRVLLYVGNGGDGDEGHTGRKRVTEEARARRKWKKIVALFFVLELSRYYL